MTIIDNRPNQITYCIQCRDAVSGKIGTFTYSGRAANGNFIASGPIFPSLQYFFDWAHSAGYHSKPASYALIMYRIRIA